MKEADEKLDGLLEESRQKILRSDEVSKYDASYFNFNSGTQLAHLLFDILKVKPVAFTESGLPSVDKDALPKYDLPFIKDILEYRKIDKIKKYINQYRKETVNNLVHPYFNLHTVDTFRSSSNAPNVQNVIKRDKMAMKLLRSFIKPRRGNRIVSYDLKSAEVYVSACYNKDPTLINYLMNPSTDMHRSFAADVFFLDEKDVSKDLRGDIKGQVFATFYGSFYKQIAPDCWEIGQKHNLIDHLKGNRIKNYIQFEEHMQKVERKFWDVRFPVYKRWRENQFNSYKENGFVEFKTGFRAYGPMSRNNSFNTPIQGSSYHMLQWGFNQVAKMMEKECERSFMLAEVHDSIIMDVHPSEEHLIDYWVWDYCTQKVREHWPWITLPIQMEKEASEIDGDWSELKTIGYLKGE
jgi:DNA polymerase-1